MISTIYVRWESEWAPTCVMRSLQAFGGQAYKKAMVKNTAHKLDLTNVSVMQYSCNSTGGINKSQSERWCYFSSFICKSGTVHQTHGYYVPEAPDSSEIEEKIAATPSLRTSLSCLFAWQVLTLGCLNSLIMNTAVSFGHGPEVVWRGQGAGFISRGE